MNRPSQQMFRVSLTADFYDEGGQPKFADLGLGLFDEQDNINVSKFNEHRSEITSDQMVDCQGVIVLTPRVTADSLADSDNLLAIGRFGVGYDSVDVDACTSSDVLAMITAGAVDRPVAEATVGWMLALTHQMLAKDRLVRTGRWDDRAMYMGCELRDRTLGVIGLGGIVDEGALFDVLCNGRIAGAALDCFEVEPVTEPHRFGELQNVILAPHSIAWTGELFRDIGRTACQSMCDLSLGQRPHGVLNPELFNSKSFREKWARIVDLSVES